MCEQVNINVSETNETINIVSSEIQEVIDINVFETAEDVTLNITEQLIQVNVNKVTAAEQIQSDWNQTDVDALDFIKNKPTSTSDFINDGEDGVNPFITAADIPPVTGFVPYTGATANVDLGEYELKAGQVTLDTSPTGTAAVATTRWNDSIGSTETTLKGGSVLLKNGVDLVARVVNKVTPNTTLTKAAYQAVRISGAQGQRLAVAYAQANNDNNSADTIGIVCETIATNQEGFILTVGQLEEINTTGSLQGETWADGDVLYLSPTTAGRLTNIKPTGATGHIVVMGYVEYAHAIHGKIYVKIMNGWELDELHNVYITSPANNEGLFYDSADSLWKNETIASALGYTPFQLPALTSGSVLFSNGTTIAQKNAQLFWDNTNNRLGVGTATPANTLDVNGTARIQNTIQATGFLINASTGVGMTNLATALCFKTNDNGANIIGNSASYFSFDNNSTVINRTSGTGRWFNVVQNASFAPTSGTCTMDWMTVAPTINQTGGANGITRGLYVAPTITAAADFRAIENSVGKVCLNTTSGNTMIGTTTDAGFKLDVNGTARVKAQSTLSTELTFSVRNSANTRNFLVVNGAGDVYNNGAGGVTSNTFFGENSGRVATGQSNSFFGQNAGASNTGGNFNSFFGISAGQANIGGLSNCFFGRISGFNNTNGSNNSFYGTQSGRFTQDGATNLTSVDNSVFIGAETKANANSETNQIVIGYQAIGAGSNTATFGNTSIVDTILRGRVNIQQYATGSRPTYVKGALIYDSTLGKLVVGGATGWEVVTSI